jgi:hypothetical protein
MNTQRQVDRQERLNKINESIDCLDEQRSLGLERLSTLQEVQSTILEREQRRLTQKYGANHPRVQKVTRRLSYNKGVKSELDQQIEISKIQVPTVNRQTWMIHGRVLTPQQKGIEGLIISLFDAHNRWIQAIEIICTDERGYFAIRYIVSDSSPTNSVISPDQPLTLTVTDDDRQILYQEPNPLFVNIGKIDYRQIILDLDQRPKTPPEPEEPSTPPPGPPKAIELQGIEGPSELRINQPGEFVAQVSADSTPLVPLTWNFGDNTNELTTTERLVSHEYSRPGSYQVSVIAEQNGGTDSATTRVQVLAAATPPGIQGIETRPENPTVGSPVQFRATVEGSLPIKGRWSFGDDSSVAEGLTAPHTFRRSGTFEVELEVANEVGRDAQRLRLNVAPTPSAEPWRVQGKIQLSGGEPLASLTIGLRLRDGTDPFDLDPAQTSEEGYYSFSFSPDDKPRLFEADPKPNFFVVILDQQGVVRARAEDPVQPQLGQTDERNITIRRPNPNNSERR